MKKFEKFKSANLKADLRTVRGGGSGIETNTSDCSWNQGSSSGRGNHVEFDTTQDGDFISTC